jgi:hypothetical protein
MSHEPPSVVGAAIAISTASAEVTVSSKNDVNLAHYKTKGRERQGEDIVTEPNRRRLSEQRAADERAQNRAEQSQAPRSRPSRKA